MLLDAFQAGTLTRLNARGNLVAWILSVETTVIVEKASEDGISHFARSA